jgi:hypothetical protein
MTIIEFIATFAGGFTFGAVVMALHKLPHDDEDDGRLGWKDVPPRELQLGKHMEARPPVECPKCHNRASTASNVDHEHWGGYSSFYIAPVPPSK